MGDNNGAFYPNYKSTQLTTTQDVLLYETQLFGKLSSNKEGYGVRIYTFSQTWIASCKVYIACTHLILYLRFL